MPVKRARHRLKEKAIEISYKAIEDLCQMLLYPLNAWDAIHHYGRSGNDEGVDIMATETLEDGTKRNWYIQCKRYKQISKKQLEEIVDDAIDHIHGARDVLLTIISCDPQKRNQEHYQKYAKERGVNDVKLWTASFLENMLYNRRQDLLFAFFGISLAHQSREKEQSLKRNITLKNKMRSDFLKNKGRGYSSQELDEILIYPGKKFIEEEIIIHSIDDIDYPDDDSFKVGISSWFKATVYDFYYNGIILRSYYQSGIVDKNGNWSIKQDVSNFDPNTYKEITIFPCMKVPFNNIVTYDITGDEYYSCPHIYCRYSEGGSPYEEIIYMEYQKGMHPKELDKKKGLIDLRFEK